MSQLEQIDAFARHKLGALEARDLRRGLTPTERGPGGAARRGGADLISFCDNDYLGLSQDPRVIEAGVAAAKTYGAGAGASRLVVGDCPLNARVEEKLAAMKGLPAARLFGSGYLANIGAIPALLGAGDLVVMDELVHACIHAGARLSGAETKYYRHNDADDARRAFEARRRYRHALLITETVFSMNGDEAPIAALYDLCNDNNAWMMTDDAHGFGVRPLDNPAPLQMGTLSKAAGSYGGYICGPASFIDLLSSRARSLIYTTGLPPATLGAALKALEIIETEPERGARALENAALFCRLTNMPAPQSAIAPVVVGAASRALALSEALLKEGFLVTAIRPPTVPEGTARLRFTFSAAHNEADICALADAYRRAAAA